MAEYYQNGCSIRCPFCGGTEMIETYQSGNGSVTAVGSVFRGAYLYHTICRNCGSVVRSYVKDPEKLLSRKDRKNYNL